MSGEVVPQCMCGGEVKRYVSQKDNANYGKSFFSCQQCKGFTWEHYYKRGKLQPKKGYIAQPEEPEEEEQYSRSSTRVSPPRRHTKRDSPVGEDLQRSEFQKSADTLAIQRLSLALDDMTAQFLKMEKKVAQLAFAVKGNQEEAEARWKKTKEGIQLAVEETKELWGAIQPMEVDKKPASPKATKTPVVSKEGYTTFGSDD